jgi:hypothetical protein
VFPSFFTPLAVVTFKLPRPTVVTNSGSSPMCALASITVRLATSVSLSGSGLLTLGRGFFFARVGRLALVVRIWV